VPAELTGVETPAADLAQPDDCRRVTRDVDCDFHAAGTVAGAGAGQAAALAGIATNLVLTARVLEAVAASRVGRCLLFSSSTVYPALDRPAREEDVESGDPHPSYAGYGWMRRYLERLGALVAGQAGIRVAIVRPTAVYGRHDNFDPATSHFVPALVRRAVERARPFEVWGTGEETRDLLHVTDLARGCLLAVEKQPSGEPVNIGCGSPVTVREVARTILDAAGYTEAEVVFSPHKPVTIRHRAVDCTKAAASLGFAPSVALDGGLRDTVRWYREQLDPLGLAAKR
jgi:GDP-L-fucose synthase